MLIEVIRESLESINKNKLRSVLTGFGIAWGIFILTLLLSISHSFDQGVKETLGGLNSRDIFYQGGTVTKVDIGSIQGAKITFNNDLLLKLKRAYENEIEYLSPQLTYTPAQPIRYNEFYTHKEINGITADYFKIGKKEMQQGRVINELDIKQSRKVILLGTKTVERLFKNTNTVVGKQVSIDNNWFKVIGVFKSATAFDFMNAAEVLMPATSLNDFLNTSYNFESFRILPALEVDPNKLEKSITSFLSKELEFNNTDKEAVTVINSYEDSESFRKLISSLTLFLWFIGISLLITGVIGISNIMYITVKERTKEIGIRKALGAKSKSITKMFLIEALLITNFSGFIGFVISFLILKLIDTVFISEDSILGDITMNLSTSISIFILLVMCGCLSGFFPARKAASIKPIEAIRYND